MHAYAVPVGRYSASAAASLDARFTGSGSATSHDAVCCERLACNRVPSYEHVRCSKQHSGALWATLRNCGRLLITLTLSGRCWTCSECTRMLQAAFIKHGRTSWCGGQARRSATSADRQQPRQVTGHGKRVAMATWISNCKAVIDIMIRCDAQQCSQCVRAF